MVQTRALMHSVNVYVTAGIRHNNIIACLSQTQIHLTTDKHRYPWLKKTPTIASPKILQVADLSAGYSVYAFNPTSRPVFNTQSCMCTHIFV